MSLNHDDVSHVVALAASLNLRDIRRSCRSRNKELPGELSSLLDALAGICISEETGEALAVGVQILPQNSIRFTFASDVNQTRKTIDREAIIADRDREKRLSAHIRCIWSILQSISERCRLQDCDEVQLQHDLETLCEKEIEQLKAVIYTFGYRRFRYRLLKQSRWDDFCLFTEIYSTIFKVQPRQESQSDFYTELQQFYNMMAVIVEEHLIADSPGEGFLYLVSGAVLLGRRILHRHTTNCERISVQVSRSRNWMTRQPFSLTNYIQKVISLEQHIWNIVGFTAFLRNREIILRHLEIEHVPSHSYPISEPSSWDKILTATLAAGHRTPVNKSRLVERLNTALPLSSDSPNVVHPAFTTHYPIHCEVALINHFVSNPCPPPLRQIGGSKRVCSACSSYIKASNLTRNIQFNKKECSGKWYFPWSFSSYDPDIIIHKTLHDIIEKIMVCLAVRKEVIRPQDWPEANNSSGFEI